jgi:glutamyl-tRNA synthetase
MMSKIKVRFAPSPTGKLHIGTCRTALFNYLFTKKNKGKFVLRFEDTDKERSTRESEKDILEALSWLSLSFDEGPYYQIKRLSIYKKYVQKLLDSNKAYPCFCTKEELEKEREKAKKNKIAYRYSGKCRNLTTDQINKYKKEGKKPVIRFKLPKELVKFKDLIKGEVEFNTCDFGDPIIMRADGIPIYNLANVVDDYEMGVAHVIRGEDLLSSTPIQILLGKALDFRPLKYAHLPMILAGDKTKLSKRHGAVAITDYRKIGYLPEALINFIVLLGWHPGEGDTREFFTLPELEKEFSLDRVGDSAAIFDIEKLDYLNGYYIRKKPLEDLLELCLPYLKESGFIKGKILAEKRLWLKEIIKSIQERMKHLSEVPQLTSFYFKKAKELDYDPNLLVPEKKGTKERTLKALQGAELRLSELQDFKREILEEDLRNLTERLEYKSFEVFWPLRVALTGQKASPGVFEVLEILGKKESIKRIKRAREKL